MSDEEEIRALVDRWMTATKAGDLDTVLTLMTDDVVFLTPGRPPMRKADFAAASLAQSSAGAPQIDAQSDIREIRVEGDWAFLWSELRVEVKPADGAPPIRRTGHTLTIFQKQNGRWLLARDANLLS